jgi:hypothetical protein
MTMMKYGLRMENPGIVPYPISFIPVMRVRIIAKT